MTVKRCGAAAPERRLEPERLPPARRDPLERRRVEQVVGDRRADDGLRARVALPPVDDREDRARPDDERREHGERDLGGAGQRADARREELGQRRSELGTHDGHRLVSSTRRVGAVRRRRAYAAAASPITFSRRSSAFIANARVSDTDEPRITVSSSPCSTHRGRSTPSAAGATSTSARWIASP